MKTHFSIAIRLTLVTMVLFGVIYPLTITGIGKVFPAREVISNGKVVGFEMIGQSFTSNKYFHGRPSAVNYNAAATGGSNKGPTNTEYLAQVQERIDNFLKQHPGVSRSEIPVDLITASGGGLDPHISVEAARVQAKRIASTRGLSVEEVQKIIDNNTKGPLLGLFGTRTVNVLLANLELDAEH